MAVAANSCVVFLRPGETTCGPRRGGKPHTAHRWRRLRIEHLEDRSLLTSVSWDGGGTTSNWTDRFNWVGDTVPGTTDTAVIDQTGTFTVTLDANVSVAGLQLGNVITGTQTLDASSHTLTVSGAAQVFAHGSLFFSNTQFFGNLTNGGILNVSLGSVSGTILNQTTGLINIGSFGFCGGTGQLTAANGLTNDGQILLRSTFECGSSGGGILTVTSGTLLNDAGATILSTGPGGAGSSLEAAGDNRGTIQADQPLSINKSAAVHRSSGTILASAEIDLFLNGDASFTNTGTVNVASGKTLFVSQGTFNNEGNLSGAGLCPSLAPRSISRRASRPTCSGFRCRPAR